MSSHLRTCPKHRGKPLPCPIANCDFGQKRVTVVEGPVTAPDPPKPKVGRPPKGDRPMTATERKRREREGPEREKLIKRIEKRIKTSDHADLGAMYAALREFHDALDQKSIDEVREIAKSYRIHDRTGRPAGEGHTGGKDLGLIDAAVQRDANGRKPRTGMTTEIYEGTPANRMPKMSLRMWDSVASIWDRVPEFTESMFQGDEKDFEAEYDPDAKPELTLHCRRCDFHTDSWFDARKHVEAMLKDAEKQIDYVKLLEEVAADTPHYEDALVEARKAYFGGLPYRHNLHVLECLGVVS